jgi:hypothetical protein
LPVHLLNLWIKAVPPVDTTAVTHINTLSHWPEDYNMKISTFFSDNQVLLIITFPGRQIINSPTHLEVQAVSGSLQNILDTNILKMTALSTLPVTAQRQRNRLLKHLL